MPYQLIYSSQATRAMSVEELEEILEDARAGNERRDITGVLVYVDGVFLQIIEGDRDEVLGLINSIRADSRHGTVTVFHEAEIWERTFANWRMAYLSASPAQLATWAGLPGATTLEAVLRDLAAGPERAAKVAANLLQALAG